MAAPLQRTSTPGVYARGSRWVAVYLEDGRQRRRSAATFRAAREIKIRATAKEAARRAGPTLHSYALEWVDHYAGRGAHDVINDRTRREYRRLLIAYALAYFEPEERLGELDVQRVRGFVDWLCRQYEPDGHRLCDRSVYNAVLPLRACLRHAHGAGLGVGDVGAAIVLPRRRRGRAYEFDERRFLTRQQLARLLAEIPEQWRTLFELLASTGLRISEAIGLRVMDAGLDTDATCSAGATCLRSSEISRRRTPWLSSFTVAHTYGSSAGHAGECRKRSMSMVSTTNSSRDPTVRASATISSASAASAFIP
jgi:integrase